LKPLNALFYTSKTLFQTPKQTYFKLKPINKFPKNPNANISKNYISAPKNPQKHYVSNLKKPYFKPPNKHISSPQKTLF
jgi:hypothetical protein